MYISHDETSAVVPDTPASIPWPVAGRWQAQGVSTEPESQPPRLPLWRYPGKWSREESFWREMTTRTLSALLAAAVIVLAGRSVGLFSQIQWSTIAKAFAAGGVWAGVLGVVCGAAFGALSSRTTRKAEHERLDNPDDTP